jgi:RimJ/RimL family protein N-acetyltransferase
MADIGVRQLGDGDWRLWRELRLEALREAPYAFGSTFAQESARDDQWWQTFWGTEVRARFVAEADGSAVGMCALVPPRRASDRLALIAMWVAPEARGTVAAAALVDAACAWTRDAGYGGVVLGVVEDNPRAQRLYERCGFAPTGETEPLHHDPSKVIVVMERAV